MLATVIHTILKLWVGGGGIKVELWELMAHTYHEMYPKEKGDNCRGRNKAASKITRY